jgi:hypothetical protein
LLIEGDFRRRQNDHQALLDCGYDAGGHLWGGVAVVGPDGAASVPAGPVVRRPRQLVSERTDSRQLDDLVTGAWQH